MGYVVRYTVGEHSYIVTDLLPDISQKGWAGDGSSICFTNGNLGALSDEEIIYAVRKFEQDADAIDVSYRDSPAVVYQNKMDTDHHAAGWVYVIAAGPYYKIGRTKNIRQRYQKIAPELPFPSRLMLTVKTDDAARLEARLHARYSRYRANGEWFKLPREAVEELQTLMQEEGGVK